MSNMIHVTSQVDKTTKIGKNVKIWNWVQIRENVVIGENTIISKSVYIDFDVKIGKNVKIQNNVSVFNGVNIEDGVFVGPHVCFTNDKNPRAINPDGSIKSGDDWEVSKTIVGYGSAIGANSTICPGVTIGRFAMIGAGSVVIKDIPDYGLVVGNPAIIIGYVCPCGNRLTQKEDNPVSILYCKKCDKNIKINKEGKK